MKLKKNTKVVFAELPGTELHSYFLLRKDAEPKDLTGVTTMLKKLGITQGYSFVKRDVLARAAARGTAIHELLQGYEMNQPVNSTIHFEWDCEDGSHKSEDEDCSQMLRKYADMVKPSLFHKDVAVEYLVSDNKSIASMIDLVTENEDGSVDLIDYKSGSSTDTTAVTWQLSIYKYLFEAQNKKIPVQNLFCIHCHDAQHLSVEKLVYLGDDKVEEALERFRKGEQIVSEESLPATLSIAELFPEHVTLVSTLETKLQLENALEIVNSQLAPIMDALKDKMRRDHLTEVLVPGGRYVFTEEHPYKRFDAKKFQKDHPDVYDKYVATSNVSASIKFYKAK